MRNKVWRTRIKYETRMTNHQMLEPEESIILLQYHR